MGDIARDFDRSEFACKCGCGFDSISLKVVDICQKLRDFFGQPITINSGCRCVEYNAEVNGAKGSQHPLGTAADVVVRNIDPQIVLEYLETYSEELGVGGLGDYDNFTHLDVRVPPGARW